MDEHFGDSYLPLCIRKKLFIDLKTSKKVTILELPTLTGKTTLFLLQDGKHSFFQLSKMFSTTIKTKDSTSLYTSLNIAGFLSVDLKKFPTLVLTLAVLSRQKYSIEDLSIRHEKNHAHQ